MPKFTIGLDYGTNSVRAVVVDTQVGREIGTGVVDYPSGQAGVLLEPRDHHLARQHPGDYLFGLEQSIRIALAQSAQMPG
ncbi:MAG: ribulokinase, partial [Rhodospirillales bacterium]|nr:ribulokinase [Acetobacter sp.]